MEPLPKDLGLLLAEQFREQMNHLSAAVQLLTPVVREKGGEHYDPYLAILHQSLYRMMRMIGNLEFLRLPEEQAAPGEGTLDLAGLCRELARQVEPLAEAAGVRFAYEEETGSLITRGDGGQLRRALLELIANAIRAAGEGGQAGLRLAVRGDRATLTVWDNGPGLALERPEPEQLLHRTGGLGLGLPLARRVAEGHGGALVLEQREGRGLRAVLSLPVRPPEEGGVLRSPRVSTDSNGGFSDVLTGLSDVLPYRAFLPGDLE